MRYSSHQHIPDGTGKWAVLAHSSILAWRIPWTEEPGGVHGVTKSLAGLVTNNTMGLVKYEFLKGTFLTL